MRVSPRENHHERCACECHPCQVQPNDESGEDRHKYNADDRKQTAIELRDGVRCSLDHRFPQDLSKTETQNHEIDRESDQRHRHQRAGKFRNGMREKCPIIMFCGLPTSVATLPMFALVASAIRYGSNGNFPRRMTAITSGVSIKQIVSLTSKAERIPDVSMRYSSSRSGVRANPRTTSAAHSKKCAR